MSALAFTARKPLHVDCLTSLADLHALRPEWDELVAASHVTIFQTWEWVTSWYEHFGRDGALRVLTFRDGDGRLLGLAPCSSTTAPSIGPRLLHLLGRRSTLTEYVDAIVQPAFVDATVRAIYDAWDASAADWDLLVLACVPADSPLAQGIQPLIARGYRCHTVEHTRVRRDLPDTWEALYHSLTKSMKDNVNNYVNRLRREGHHEQLVVADVDGLDAALDTFFELHRQRAQSNLTPPHQDRFRFPERRAFLRTVARRLMERGKFWPALLYVDEKPVAAQLGLVHDRCFYRYYSGFDPAWARNGVMTVLTRRCVERAIEHGCRELDLLLGMDAEKLRWGAEPRQVVNVTLASPRLRSQLALRLYELKSALEGRLDALTVAARLPH